MKELDVIFFKGDQTFVTRDDGWRGSGVQRSEFHRDVIYERPLGIVAEMMQLSLSGPHTIYWTPYHCRDLAPSAGLPIIVRTSHHQRDSLSLSGPRNIYRTPYHCRDLAHGKKRLIEFTILKNGTTIQYGNFHPQIIVTVSKNLIIVAINLVKVTILYCCVIFYQNTVNSINLFISVYAYITI